MEFDPRYGVFHRQARDDYELPCRKCGEIVVESAAVCKNCGTTAPGIYSYCPSCYSENYTWKLAGVNIAGAIAGQYILGPLGAAFFLLKGSHDAECICLDCGQGWIPFAITGGRWNKTKKYKLSAEKDSNGKVRLKQGFKEELKDISKAYSKEKPKFESKMESKEDREKRRLLEAERRKKLLEEKRRQEEEHKKALKAAREEEIRKARQRVKKRIIWIVIIIIAYKYIKIQINAHRDDWKIAYDNILTPKREYDMQQYYALSDMNFDGIPELISFKYMDNGSTYFDICTYRNKSIAILYSAYNVIPYEIGTSVSLYNDRGNNGVSVYRCSMFAGGIDCSESEKKKVPEAAGLLTYEAGDILSGRYKDKKASLDYTEPAEKSEYWDLDMDAIYDMLKSGYTTSDVMHRLNVEGLQVSGSSNSSDRFIFDTYIMGHLGEMKYTTSIPLIFSWYTNDYIAGSEFADYYNLEKIGDTNFGNGYIHYTYNELLAIEIKSGKKYGTHVSILLER